MKVCRASYAQVCLTSAGLARKDESNYTKNHTFFLLRIVLEAHADDLFTIYGDLVTDTCQSRPQCSSTHEV